MITEKNTNFPVSYGDEPTDDGSRLSDKILHFLQKPEVQKYFFHLGGAVLALGSAARAANAIPPEAGEAAGNAAEAAINLNGEQLPPIGDIQGAVNLPAAPPEPNLKLANLPGPGPGPGQNPMPGPRIDRNPPVLKDKGLWLPAKPITTAGQITATSTFVCSLTVLCLQAGFNPVAVFMCASGILGTALYVAKPSAIAAAKFILKVTGAS